MILRSITHVDRVENHKEKQVNLDTIFWLVGIIIYVIMALVALWGAYCVTMVITRVRQKQFVSEEQQTAFLEALSG